MIITMDFWNSTAVTEAASNESNFGTVTGVLCAARVSYKYDNGS